MLILGIETSCDETAASLVRDGREVLSNVISSQIDIHRLTNGVVPEVAARAHVGQIQAVYEEALVVPIDEVDAIAVTAGPGLLTSLIVGTSFASALAWAHKKPLIPVNHIYGHILSNWLDRTDEIQFPVVVLTVSGGHNNLVLLRSETDFEILGETLDDAAGEAYDKVAKMLGLQYPGGPEISRIASKGNAHAYEFPRPIIGRGDDFSFSGLKSAVRRELASDFVQEDVAASFQEAVNDVLSAKLIVAAQRMGAKEIHLAGGVSANTHLREMINARREDLKFRHPVDISFCTDNAAMIAGAAFYVSKDDWLTPGMAIQPSLDFDDF